MINVNDLRGFLAKHDQQWQTVVELASGIGTDDERGVRNELSSLFIQHYNTGDFAWQPTHSEPAVVMRPGDPVTYHYAPSMTAADYASVVNACLAQALAAPLKSEARGWWSRAEQSLRAMRAYLEG